MKWAGKNLIHAVVIVTLTALVAIACGGQASAAIHMRYARIEGSQEVPPNGSPATGTGVFTIDDVANTVTYHIVFTVGSLTSPEIAAHVHCCAPPGMNAGVIIPLPLGSPKDGMGTITPANIGQVLAGNAYVNIHTQMFTGGEIRGQILMPTSVPISFEPTLEPSSWGAVKVLYR
jgi:hypothetical protein